MDNRLRLIQRNGTDKISLIRHGMRAGITIDYDEPQGPLDLKEARCSKCNKYPLVFSDCCRCKTCMFVNPTGKKYDETRAIRLRNNKGNYLRYPQIWRCACCQPFYI